MKQGKKKEDVGSLVDRGWMKMQPILATELPLEDKKDRRTVWLWVSLMSIALIGLSVWLFPTSNTNPIASPATHANKINSTDLNKTSQSTNLKEDNNAANSTPQINETKSINEGKNKNIKTVPQSKKVNLIQDSNNNSNINTENINQSIGQIQKNTTVQPKAIHQMPNNASKAEPKAQSMAIPKALPGPTQKENKKTTTPILKNTVPIQNNQQIELASLNPIQIDGIKSNTLQPFPVLMDIAILEQKAVLSQVYNMNIDARGLYTPSNNAKGMEIGLNPSWRKGKYGIGFSIGAGYNYVNYTQITTAFSADASPDMQEDNSTADTNIGTPAGVGFSSELMAYDRNTPPLEYVTTETILKASKRYALVALSLDYYLNDRMCISNIFGATYNFDSAQSWDELLPTNSLIDDISQDLYNYNNSPLSYFGELRIQYNSANKLGVNIGFRYNLKAQNQQYPYSLTAGVSYRL